MVGESDAQLGGGGVVVEEGQGGALFDLGEWRGAGGGGRLVGGAAGEEEKAVSGEQQRPAVLLNLFLGGGEDKPIRVIEGQARAVGATVRLAGEVVRAIAEPGCG